MNGKFENYIGVFDSGVGGISVLQELTKLLPHEKFVFFGDSANAPYGEREVEEVQRLTINAVQPLVDAGVKALVIACNTATSSAINLLREMYQDIPVIGVEPALKPAVDAGYQKILVMATPVTLTLEKFHELEERVGTDVEVIALPCPGLAGRIEKADLEAEDLQEMLSRLLYCHVGKIDSVVLGCTHYPFIRKQIKNILGNVPFYDGGAGTARELKRRLAEKNALAEEKGPGEIVFMSSKETEEEVELYKWFYKQKV